MKNLVSTGIEGLDIILNGGVPKGKIYLVTGPSGSGKTTCSLQFLMEGARNGERSLYIGTSETKEEIKDIASSHDWNISGISIHHDGGSTYEKHGPEQTMLHPAELELPRTVENIMKIVDEEKPNRLVLDSLTEIKLLSKEGNWFRDQMMTLRKHFIEKRCTVFLTDLMIDEQPVLRSIVNGVIELDFIPPVYGPDRRYIRIPKIRGHTYSTGKHDMKISKGGLMVYPRLVAAEHRHRFIPENLTTGIEKLDQLLGGGLDKGTSTLLIGPTGMGKSVLSTQIAVSNAKKGIKSAMFIFDERVQTLFQRAETLGLELEKYHDAGMVEVRQIDPAELTPGEFTQIVMDTEDNGAKIVIIDSLNGFSYAMPEERLLSLHLHELLSYLNQKGITSLHIMTQHGFFSSIQQTFDVSYIADTVILLKPVEDKGILSKTISVYKRRAGPHGKTINYFLIDPEGINIGDPVKSYSGIIEGNPRLVTDVGEKRSKDKDE